MHYLFYKNLLEKVKLNKYQLHYAFWNPAIFKNIKLLNLEEEYNNSLFTLPNIYEPIEDVIKNISINNYDISDICLTYDLYSLKKLIDYNYDIIDWDYLSLNNHITIQDVIDNPDYDWSLEELCNNENFTIEIIENNNDILNDLTIGINNPNLTFDMIKKYDINDYDQAEYPFSYNINATLEIAVINSNKWWDYESILSNYNVNLSKDYIDTYSNILFNNKGYFRYLLSNPAITIKDIELYLPITILNKYYKDINDDILDYINDDKKSPMFIYINSLFLNPNISIYYINKYSNIENYITSLIKNKFCYHEYYKSNIYKKLLVKKFIYHNKDSIIKHLRS